MNTAAPDSGACVSVGSQLLDREQGQDRSSQLEGEEVFGLEDERPTDVAVEGDLTLQVLHAESDRVRERCRAVHDNASVERRNGYPAAMFTEPRIGRLW